MNDQPLSSPEENQDGSDGQYTHEEIYEMLRNSKTVMVYREEESKFSLFRQKVGDFIRQCFGR